MTILINGQWAGSSNGYRYPIGTERIQRLVHTNSTITPDLSYSNADMATKNGVKASDLLIEGFEKVKIALSNEAFNDVFYNLGCDCGGELIPMSMLNEKYAGDLRVLWFDAHPDIHSVDSSDSGAFHGMILRSLLGQAPEQFQSYIQTPLALKNVLYAGVRAPDRGEQDYLAHNPIAHISVEELERQVPSMDDIEPLLGGPVYIHFDYDVLEPLHHPNTVFPTKGGIAIETALTWIKFVRQHCQVVGYSLTEYAPVSLAYNERELRQILDEGFGIPLP